MSMWLLKCGGPYDVHASPKMCGSWDPGILGTWTLDSRSCINPRILNLGFWILDSGILASRILRSWILDCGSWILDPRMLDPGFWILDPASLILDLGILDPGILGSWFLDQGSWMLESWDIGILYFFQPMIYYQL